MKKPSLCKDEREWDVGTRRQAEPRPAQGPFFHSPQRRVGRQMRMRRDGQSRRRSSEGTGSSSVELEPGASNKRVTTSAHQSERSCETPILSDHGLVWKNCLEGFPSVLRAKVAEQE